MSKSLGNVLLVRDLLGQAPGEAIRTALLAAHYRQPLDWSAGTLRQAHRSLDRLYGALRHLGDAEAGAGDAAPYLATFHAALDDDLNTPVALAELSRLARLARHATAPAIRAALKTALVTAGGLLGILRQPPAGWLMWTAAADPNDGDTGIADQAGVEALVAEREEARATKDFVRADRLRDRLTGLGVVVEDRAGRTAWRRAAP